MLMQAGIFPRHLGLLVLLFGTMRGLFVGARKWQFFAPSVVVAEAWAILFGCEFALSLGLQKIIVESDSKENISALLDGVSSGSWKSYPILSRIVRLRDSFQTCRWSWVPRSVNEAADRLASRCNSEMCGSTWRNHPPSSLVGILDKDGLPCPP